MKIARRILITLAATLTTVFAVIYFVCPIALSFYGASKAIPITRVVPAELKDLSVASAPGERLSYLGYEFEVPWDDLNESQTILMPKDRPDKNRVILNFRSGLRIMATRCQPREMADEFMRGDFKMSPAAFAAVFGPKAADSDYEFTRRVFEFSPDNMHHWALGPPVHAREFLLLLTKSMVPSKSAESGIFNVHNATYEGYQQGNPRAPSAKEDGIVLTLYSADDTIELVFAQKRSTHLITQPEINRVVESLHKAPTSAASNPPRVASN